MELQEAVVDTIVAKVQGVPGDDRCVLLLGYREQMQEMLRNANPSLSRRFQLEDAWEFEDFDDTQLFKILRAKAKSAYDWDIPVHTAKLAVQLLAKERRKPNFGNAGAVNNLLARAAQRMEKRTANLSPLYVPCHNSLVVNVLHPLSPSGAPQ
jgi:Cdc6-like AAA superfamily ATPase